MLPSHLQSSVIGHSRMFASSVVCADTDHGIDAHLLIYLMALPSLGICLW